MCWRGARLARIAFVAALPSAGCSSGASTTPDVLMGDGAASQTLSALCSLDASDGTSCLTGSCVTAAFSAPATAVSVGLFAAVPLGQEPIAQELLGADGTWSFDTSMLAPGPQWSHYYVEISAQFGLAGTLTRVIGPLSVSSVGGPATVRLQPAHVEVLESRAAEGGSMQFRSASAHVFDPKTGAEITDGTAVVAIGVGATSVPMPWDANAKAYDVTSSPSLDAQPTYSMTLLHPALGPTPITLELVADLTTLNGAITSPAADAIVDAGPIEIAWQPETAADFVQVDIFQPTDAQAGDGGVGDAAPDWDPNPVYASPTADDANATVEVVPAGTLTQWGPALINVVYTLATCPATADGCVYSGTVFAETINVVGPDGGEP